uniref:SCP domain-containing protein n=1 Tax=Strongyloides stercoralis TaxID=6248 RepID=A0A0K0E240_STRER
MKYLLITIQLIIVFIFFINSQTPKTPLIKRRFSWHTFPTRDTFLEDSKKVSYYLVGARVLFECNGFVFTKHKKAIDYYNLIHSNTSIKKSFKPAGGIRPTRVPGYDKKYKINEYDYNSVVVRNPFTRKIWKTIWYGCYYYCLKANNFKLLKTGLLSEINHYRKLHGSRALVEVSHLDQAARSCINEKIATNDYKLKNSKKFGSVYFATYKTNINLILKDLFDRFFGYYNYGNNFFLKKFEKQTLMLWNRTTLVGLDAFLRGDIVHILFIFYSKGNIDGEYRKNIFPVSDKVLHMYNTFKRHLE